MRQRPAPNAVRTAIFFSHAVAPARSKFTIFALAINNETTAPSNNSSDVRISFVVQASKLCSRTAHPAFGSQAEQMWTLWLTSFETSAARSSIKSFQFFVTSEGVFGGA